jgi:hypothetical protein
MRISFAQFPDSSASNALMQGTVSISSNVDCKADTNFGKYVTDANICISATDKFVCAVSHQFYSLPTIELAFLRAQSQIVSQLQGDVGGPVLVLSSPGIWTQIGINSYTPSNDLNESILVFVLTLNQTLLSFDSWLHQE